MTSKAVIHTDAPSPFVPPPAPSGGFARVLANLAHLVGGKAGAGVMSLVYLVVVARALGVRDYGVLTLVNGYALLVGSVIAFSGFHGVVRYGALAIEAEDPRRLASILRAMTVVELGCGAVAILIAAVAAPIVGPRLGWTPEAVRVALPYSLAVLGTVRATPQGLLQLARRFDLIGAHQLVSPVVKLAGTLAVWAAGGGLTAYLAIWLGAAIAEGAAMWALAWPAWTRLTGGERLAGPWRGAIRREGGFARFAIAANLDITLRELAPNLAPLTVGWLLGPAAAGLFSLAQRATTLFQQPAALLSQASYSVLADLAARREHAALARTVLRSAAFAGAAAGPFLLLFAAGGARVLPLVGGRSFAGSARLVLLMAMARAALLVATPFSAGLTALGRPGRSVTIALVANLALYPLLPVLIHAHGLDGAGWHALAQGLLLLVATIVAFGRAI
jgi:O-antigen/teichoic acid export membrane protein